MEILKFKENLKEIMKENKITQIQLAKKLNTTQQTISRWMKGTNEPDLTNLILICLYLKETPNSILGFDEITPKQKNTLINNGTFNNNVNINFN